MGEDSYVTTGEDLAARVRAALVGAGAVREVGASQRGLRLRVGKDRQAEALGRPGARPMVMRGRAMEGYVYVDPATLNERTVRTWLRPALPYVQTLPPRSAARKPRRVSGKRAPIASRRARYSAVRR